MFFWETILHNSLCTIFVDHTLKGKPRRHFYFLIYFNRRRLKKYVLLVRIIPKIERYEFNYLYISHTYYQNIYGPEKYEKFTIVLCITCIGNAGHYVFPLYWFKT